MIDRPSRNRAVGRQGGQGTCEKFLPRADVAGRGGVHHPAPHGAVRTDQGCLLDWLAIHHRHLHHVGGSYDKSRGERRRGRWERGRLMGAGAEQQRGESEGLRGIPCNAIAEIYHVHAGCRWLRKNQ